MYRPTVIACDFDGTLHYGTYPDIGKPNLRLMSYLINCRKCGIKVVLNTMREGELLEKAVDFCKLHGLDFDAINDNVPELIAIYGTNPRKIAADFYIDNNVALCGFGKPLPDLKKRGLK